VRCDLHVHSRYSGTYRFPVFDGLCNESYSPPQGVYEKLKALKMDLVTLTDHDSISGCEELRRHPDFFSSEEVTCRMPSGTEAHVAVYDISERQHVEIQRRREDLPRLLGYLHEQQLFYSAQHIFSGLTGRREEDDFEWFAARFPAIETLNAHLPSRGNAHAARFAQHTGKAFTAGSDGHTLLSVGTAFTEVPGARTKAEFLAGLRQGKGRPRGESGTFWKMTRDALLITASMIAEEPAKVLFAPLAAAVPVFTAWHFCQEKMFLRKWERVLAVSSATDRGRPGSAPRRTPCPGSVEAVA
jgi:predicted metal-dependent phosphoesterase TrpH